MKEEDKKAMSAEELGERIWNADCDAADGPLKNERERWLDAHENRREVHKHDWEKRDGERKSFEEASKQASEIWERVEETKSHKDDRKDGKLRWELLPLQTVEEVVKVYSYGAAKYGCNTWQELENGYERYKAALLRHVVAFEKGETHDKESGIHSLAHAAWNAIAMLHIAINQRYDDGQEEETLDVEDEKETRYSECPLMKGAVMRYSECPLLDEQGPWMKCFR